MDVVAIGTRHVENGGENVEMDAEQTAQLETSRNQLLAKDKVNQHEWYKRTKRMCLGHPNHLPRSVPEARNASTKARATRGVDHAPTFHIWTPLKHNTFGGAPNPHVRLEYHSLDGTFS
jgi:hypothetical protein